MSLRNIWRIAALLALTLGFLGGAARAADYTVYVEPIEVFNSSEVRELSPGLRSMIASRITGNGYAVSTDEGAKAGALLNLRTTVTKLGGLLSLDSELYGKPGGPNGARAYETVPNVDELMKGMEKLCERIKLRLGQIAADPAYAQTAPPLPAVPLIEKHPPGWSPHPAAEPKAPVVFAKSDVRTLAETLAGFKEAARLEGEAPSICAADINRDGAVEVVTVSGKEFFVFRETETGLEKVWQGATGVGFTPLFVSAGDVDGDGAAEVFLAGSSGYDAYTQAYAWNGQGLVKKGQVTEALLRVQPDADRGVQLVGMKSVGGAEVLIPTLRVFAWTGKGYEAGPKVPMPDYVKTLNQVWVRFEGGTLSLLALDADRHLRIYDEKLQKQFVSENRMMGSRSRIEGERDVRGTASGSAWELDSYPVMWKAQDGHVYAVVHNNFESSYTPSSWGMFENGSLTAIRWDGAALHVGADSPKFQGYFSGVARGATDEKGRGRLYASLVKAEGTLFKSYKTIIFAFDL